MLDAAFNLAAAISSKSPVAVQGTKINLLYSRDHSVAEGLNFMVMLSIWPITTLLSSQNNQSELSGLCRPFPLIGVLLCPRFLLVQLQSCPILPLFSAFSI